MWQEEAIACFEELLPGKAQNTRNPQNSLHPIQDFNTGHSEFKEKCLPLDRNVR
jgi:hypothetical protein